MSHQRIDRKRRSDDDWQLVKLWQFLSSAHGYLEDFLCLVALTSTQRSSSRMSCSVMASLCKVTLIVELEVDIGGVGSSESKNIGDQGEEGEDSVSIILK